MRAGHSSFLSLGWARQSGWTEHPGNMNEHSQNKPLCSFLRDLISLPVLLSCWYINVFSSMWACRGSYGDPFLMDNNQYHWALNWEGRVKKTCSVLIWLAGEAVCMYWSVWSVILLKLLPTCCAKDLGKLLDSPSVFIQDSAGREVCQSCF